MTFYILTLFPEMFETVAASSILKRATDKRIIKIRTVNIRDFAKDKHKTVDDKPYGGGKGMILKVDVLVNALETIKPKPALPASQRGEPAGRPYTILLSPSGKKYDQQKALFFSRKTKLAIICGHYEGTDARIEKYVDEVISIGDFVLTGGEIAAMAIVDSVARLIPGVSKKESLEFESFSSTTNYQLPTTLLEYPQYTRPEDFRGLKVPKILLSGNHQQISNWRQKQAFNRTKKWRPDLIKINGKK